MKRLEVYAWVFLAFIAALALGCVLWILFSAALYVVNNAPEYVIYSLFGILSFVLIAENVYKDLK